MAKGQSDAIRGGWAGPALLLLALGLTTAPLLLGGYPRGHDWPFELVRVAEFRAALAGGQLPPYWAENLYGGYGSPIFLFYAPLFVAAASLAGAATGSLASGSTLVLVAAAALGLFTALRFFESLTSRGAAAARIGAYVWVLHPYLLGDALVRNANAEYIALCLLPLPLHGVVVAGARPRAGAVRVALGLGLVILAHNLTALVAPALVFALAAFLYAPRPAPRTVGSILLGAALGLGLGAVLWVPALWLRPLVQTERLLVGKFDFHWQFPALAEAFGWGRFFGTGWLTPALLVAAAAALFARVGVDQRSRRALLGCVAGGALLVFFVHRASMTVWETAPFLPLFQFPWRLLGPLALLAATAATLLASALLRGRSARRVLAVELLALALCAANSAPRLRDMRPLEAAELGQFERMLEPPALRKSELRATVLDEYLPRGAYARTWQVERPQNGPLVFSRPPAAVHVVRDSGTRIALNVQADRASVLRIARWAFPGWALWVNGEPRSPHASALGSLEVDVPAGNSQVELVLGPPLVRRASGLASLGALVTWVALATGRPRRVWRWLGS